ncbi:TPA: DNA utilization protein GntX [Raoultella terrigena]|uniref:DNA utilization protein GntX n=1 Tax=Raoultella terrigena TaxID=577 RepID=A0A7Z8Z7N5_RAOTE|nr:DNA utilization protein GntX [Raoultella terrigena]QPF09170.1 DNA utilization protein GntX [Raoultella terrigena]ROS18926.1 ComF family protein [Raoultella terrigena]VED45808.1 putative gluconate transporter periplasmic gluconate-binding protein [Raoultella terrigena]VUC71072.1 Competence protein F [Raoultella terrigena]
MLTAHGLCWLCQMPLAIASWGFCSRCSASLTTRQPRCPRCGLPAGTASVPCGRCIQDPPPWQRLVAVSDYLPPLSGLIHQLKFTRRPELAPALARLLLLRIRQSAGLPPVDRIVGVPLWQRRQWRRGFNQSDLLCRPLARWTRAAWRSDALRRSRPTATQHQLTARLRKRNLKNAFQLELSVRGHHIAIVDDVVTTGSTVAEISRLLLRNGAATVQVWCMCRTL